MQVDAARHERTVRAAAGLDGRPDLGLGHAELGGTRADGQAGMRLGGDVRVQPVQDVEAEPGLPGAPDGERERLGFLGRLDRHPPEWLVVRGGPRHVAQVGRRLADALERDSLVRHARAARQRPLAARDDVRAEPARRHLRDDRRHVIGLDRVVPDDRVRKGVAHRRARGVERREVGDEEGRTEASGGAAQRLLEVRLSP